MIVTPKANDFTGRKDSRGYISDIQVGQAPVPSLRPDNCS